MSYLDRIGECNAHDLTHFRPFRIEGQQVGWIKHAFAGRLEAWPEVFQVGRDSVDLAPDLIGYEARTRAVERVLRALADEGLIQGWRDEPYPVAERFGQRGWMEMERAGVPRFGITAYGVHMNGFVRSGEGLKMWIGRRARGKATYPGMLDNMVAGGQPVGLSLRDNLVKECGEEADIPPDLAAKAVSVGAISYMQETQDGLKPDVMFVYDLELPAGFQPRNTDGEIESFQLMPVHDVAAIVRDTAEFKFNCNLVVIDFLVRHGVLGPEDPDYLAILRGLRR